jgi:hypothetical protein
MSWFYLCMEIPRLPIMIYDIHIQCEILFRTKSSRDRDVVLVGRTVDLGKPRGIGKLEWGGNGEGMWRGEVSL